MKGRVVDTRFGSVTIGVDGGAIAFVRTPGCGGPPFRAEPDALLDEAERQIQAYFSGDLREFELPIRQPGTPFQQEVWAALRDIPYGQVCAYRDIAARIGRPAAVRAVGAANGANQVAILVPCHRVIGANGALTGYAGGLHLKTWLLAHERGERPMFGV